MPEREECGSTYHESKFKLRLIYAKFGDSGWKQEYEDPQFYQQIKWELKGLQEADHVLVYFDPATKSPVSLLELGAFNYKAIVICPQGFWRKGNVDIFCEEFNVKQVPDLRSAVEYIVTSHANAEAIRPI